MKTIVLAAGLGDIGRVEVLARIGPADRRAERADARAIGRRRRPGTTSSPRRHRCRPSFPRSSRPGPRSAPRWSVVGAVIMPEGIAKLKAPASIAGLPARSAIVSVGPPLFASVPSKGLVTPTRFPLTPLVNPLVIPPIRLFELAACEEARDVAGASRSSPCRWCCRRRSCCRARLVPGEASIPPPAPPAATRVVGDRRAVSVQDSDLIDPAAVLTCEIVGDRAVRAG